jgi:hypothetical protein
VHAKPVFLTLHIAGAALALRDDLVLALELRGCLPEGFPGPDLAAAKLTPQLEIPVLGHLLRAGEALFLGADAAVPAGFVGGALPEAAAGPLVDMELAAHQGVGEASFAWAPLPDALLCKACVRALVRRPSY